VKAYVVNEVLMRIGERGVHLRNLLSQLSNMLVSSSLRGQGSYVGLKNEPRLEHLPGEEAVQGSEHGKRARIKCRRARGDEGAGSVAAFEDAHRGEEADAGAEAGAADLELAGEFAFGGETVAGVDLAAADKRANVLDDLHGELAMACGLVV
jgi:hypothetical protein